MITIIIIKSNFVLILFVYKTKNIIKKLTCVLKQSINNSSCVFSVRFADSAEICGLNATLKVDIKFHF